MIAGVGAVAMVGNTRFGVPPIRLGAPGSFRRALCLGSDEGRGARAVCAFGYRCVTSPRSRGVSEHGPLLPHQIRRAAQSRRYLLALGKTGKLVMFRSGEPQLAVGIVKGAGIAAI
jgi:hypothetical protein